MSYALLVTQAAGDFAGAAVQLGHVDEPGLVEVGEPAPFGCGGVDFAVESGELGACSYHADQVATGLGVKV